VLLYSIGALLWHAAAMLPGARLLQSINALPWRTITARD
jgi:hypothetical protein